MLFPDTLNLEETAALAIDNLTANVDPDLNYTQYFDLKFQFEPPALLHHYYWDHCDGTGRTVDALILARHMTGNILNKEIDDKLKQLTLSYVGADGLCWIPQTPYREPRKPAWHQSRPEPPVADFWGQRACLMAFLSWYETTKDRSIKDRIDNLIGGLWDIAVKKDGRCYYPFPAETPERDLDELLYPPTGWASEDEPVGTGVMCASAPVIRPIVQYLETGNENETALKLCEGLADYVVYRAQDYGEDGSFRGHFHSRVATAAGILKYGLFVNRQDLVEWVMKVYGFARSTGTDFGWFPEYVGGQACETCGITDMIDLTIILAEAGWTDYWDLAERYGRNHLVESQFTDVEWERELPKKSEEEAEEFFSTLDPRSYRRGGVADVVKGGFSGGSSPNSIVDLRRGHWWMGCCNAHGVHGLYLLWHHAVRRREQGVFVNLLFNRASSWVVVASHLPYEGRVEVRILDAPVLFVRVPRGVPRSEVEIDTTGGEWMWVGSYVRFSGLRAGDEVSIAFPVAEREDRVRVLGDEYAVQWRGDTVVSIDPPGKNGPLYRREHMRKGNPPLVERDYHAPSPEIDW